MLERLVDEPDLIAAAKEDRPHRRDLVEQRHVVSGAIDGIARMPRSTAMPPTGP